VRSGSQGFHSGTGSAQEGRYAPDGSDRSEGDHDQTADERWSREIGAIRIVLRADKSEQSSDRERSTDSEDEPRKYVLSKEHGNSPCLPASRSRTFGTPGSYVVPATTLKLIPLTQRFPALVSLRSASTNASAAG
jgi:hypothetical protein